MTYSTSSSSSSSSLSTLANPSVVDLDLQNSFDFLPDRWFFFQLFIFSLFLAITILIFVMIYQCLASMRRERIRQNKTISTVQIPLPAASPLLLESHRETSKRISTISSAPSDTKSRCTETSIVLNTPLNLYPTSYSRSSASSYFIYPSDYEQLCK